MDADGKKGNHEDFRVYQINFSQGFGCATDSKCSATESARKQAAVVQSGEHIAGYQPLGQSTRSYQRDERPGAVRTRQPPFRRRRTAHRESTRQRGQEDVHRLHRPRLRALSSNPRVGQAPERLAVPGVCQRLRRHGDSPGGVDGSTVWLRIILNRPDASTKLAAPVFYFLGFAACFAATIARPFCFVAAALACFGAACFCVDFGDLSPIMLKLPPLVWQTRALNRPTFGIAPLTFAPQPCLTIN